jgi:hypothetical protein
VFAIGQSLGWVGFSERGRFHCDEVRGLLIAATGKDFLDEDRRLCCLFGFYFDVVGRHDWTLED